MRLLTAVVSVAALLAATAGPAGATWSVVGAEPESGQVGVALAACVPIEVLGKGEGPLIPIVIVPGSLAAVVQGEPNPAATGRILELAKAETEPSVIVGALMDEEFDGAWTVRQYGLVDSSGQAAVATGPDLPRESGGRSGPYVSVQGSVLLSPQVVEEAMRGFVDTAAAGGDLGRSLAAGLLAGSRAGGDRGCPEQSALFAQLVVSRPNDPIGRPSLVLTVTVDPGDGQNPVELLAKALNEGQSGLIDAGGGRDGGGTVVAIVASFIAVAMAIAGVAVFRYGMGTSRIRGRDGGCADAP